MGKRMNKRNTVVVVDIARGILWSDAGSYLVPPFHEPGPQLLHVGFDPAVCTWQTFQPNVSYPHIDLPLPCSVNHLLVLQIFL